MPFAGKTAAERYETEKRYIARRRDDPERQAKYRSRMSNYAKTRRQTDPAVKEAVYASNAASQARAHRDPIRWPARAVVRLRHIAKQKGIPFNLAPEDIEVPEACPVFGTPFVYGAAYRDNAGPSVDRIIPSLGYVKGNVKVISLKANRLKHDCTDPSELRRVADYIESTTPCPT